MDTYARMISHPLIYRLCSMLVCIGTCLTLLTGSLTAQTPATGNSTVRFLQPTTPTMLPSHTQSQGQLKSVVQQTGFSSALPDEVLQEGLQYERGGQWGEALSYYQEMLREYPDNDALQKKRSLSRIHYDLHRRYADTSFIRTISNTGGTKAANVYAEVLLKIQSYYVDSPNWNEIAGYGLTSLEVAVHAPEFREINLSGISDSQISSAIQKTRQMLKQYPASNRHEIYAIANAAAKSLESDIGLSSQATIYEFICGAISALDPYSAFMSSNQYEETMSQIEGNFVGLGVELRTMGDILEIVGVIPNGSAGVGGIREGDRITYVDNYLVADVGSERAADMLRGVEGSKVALVIERKGKAMRTELERKRVDIPSVSEVSLIDRENGVGYINLTNFQKTTARDFDEALWKLHRQGMRTLIVDVRGNPGGLLSASVEVADRFVGSGVIVSTHGRNPMEDYTHRAQVANTWRVPLVVLVDEDSASASEIFAAAIRDHQRGTIVGRRSYGKGSVQGIFPLNVSGGGVRLTTAKFYSPTGHPISQVGVDADVVVQGMSKPSESHRVSANDDDMRVGIQAAIRAAEIRQQAQRQAVVGRG